MGVETLLEDTPEIHPSRLPKENWSILDHGYVRLIEVWGSDQRIIESARMSTDKGFLGWGPKDCCDKCGLETTNIDLTPRGGLEHANLCDGEVGRKSGDEKLLRYLYEHAHNTPFEFGGLTIEVQAPIMVFREWHRHRTQSYNEMSGRYTKLPDLFYLPSVERIMRGKQSTTNKQGSEEGFSIEQATNIRARMRLMLELERRLYDDFCNEGLAKELARGHLGVYQYSRMRASGNLRNWLAFMTLRDDKAAQFEIRQFAGAVGEAIARSFPRTWELFLAKRERDAAVKNFEKALKEIVRLNLGVSQFELVELARNALKGQ